MMVMVVVQIRLDWWIMELSCWNSSMVPGWFSKMSVGRSFVESRIAVVALGRSGSLGKLAEWSRQWPILVGFGLERQQEQLELEQLERPGQLERRLELGLGMELARIGVERWSKSFVACSCSSCMGCHSWSGRMIVVDRTAVVVDRIVVAVDHIVVVVVDRTVVVGHIAVVVVGACRLMVYRWMVCRWMVWCRHYQIPSCPYRLCLPSYPCHLCQPSCPCPALVF